MIKRTIYNSAICICAAIILIVTLLYSPRLLGSERFNVKNINEWTTENGIEKIPFALTQNNDGTSKISTVLPDTIEDDSYLCFWSYLSSVSAYIDAKKFTVTTIPTAVHLARLHIHSGTIYSYPRVPKESSFRLYFTHRIRISVLNLPRQCLEI